MLYWIHLVCMHIAFFVFVKNFRAHASIDLRVVMMRWPFDRGIHSLNTAWIQMHCADVCGAGISHCQWLCAFAFGGWRQQGREGQSAFHAKLFYQCFVHSFRAFLFCVLLSISRFLVFWLFRLCTWSGLVLVNLSSRKYDWTELEFATRIISHKYIFCYSERVDCFGLCA